MGVGWDVGCHFSAEILGVKSRHRGRCAHARELHLLPPQPPPCVVRIRKKGRDLSAKKGVNMEKSQPLMFHGLPRLSV